MTDQEIITDIQTGGRTRDAVATYLISRSGWATDLTKLVLSRGGDRDLARQLYIDTYLSFQENIITDKFQGKSSLKTYFLSIAANKLNNHFRKQAKDRFLIATDPLELDAPEQLSENSQLLKVILPRVMVLMAERCKLLLAFSSSGYKHKEIAEEMGFSSDSVAANEVKKCRDALRAQIEQMIQAK